MSQKNSSSDHENRSTGVSPDPLNSSYVIQSTSPYSEHILNHSHKKWKKIVRKNGLSQLKCPCYLEIYEGQVPERTNSQKDISPMNSSPNDIPRYGHFPDGHFSNYILQFRDRKLIDIN